MNIRRSVPALLAVVLLLLVTVVASNGAEASARPPKIGPAVPAPLAECESLTGFVHEATEITGAAMVAAGELTNAGQDIGAHCLVTGKMNERVSPVDGDTYAIGFEMRLPVDWSGRYLYQANGGIDGRVATAIGTFSGGGVLNSGLQLGFAIISSDAGHSGSQNPFFGLDPQARLDYGYQAVGTLTPMAKALIEAAYGKGPDTSYIGGSSNGGRHTMVAAARYGDQYDGFLALAPGFNLPKAAVAQLWGAQQWATVATDVNDLETALTVEERRLIADAILARCDRIDRLVDGTVQDLNRCNQVFKLDRSVPTCTGARNGTCLTAEQKDVVEAVFAGAVTGSGEEFYNSFPLDPGIVHDGWAGWKFRNSVGDRRDPPAVAFIFSSPPEDRSILDDTLGYALNFDIDTDGQKIFATSGIYTESAMSFMTPPDPDNLDTVYETGAKMIVIHGTADGVFSVDDTEDWYKSVRARYRGKAGQFVRFFKVPGMGHSRGGPATDQFDGLTALINWVEYGEAPSRIEASVRGEGNPGGANGDLPADWSPERTRPLCHYPYVARYHRGDPDQASSFRCQLSRALVRR